MIHWTAYASWPLALIHGLGTGSDAKAPSLIAIVFSVWVGGSWATVGLRTVLIACAMGPLAGLLSHLLILLRGRSASIPVNDTTTAIRARFEQLRADKIPQPPIAIH